MFQETEIINLIIGIISVFLLIFLFRVKKEDMPRFPFIYLGFLLIVCALIFTVIEGFVLNDFFNLLEHLCYMLAGICFATGIYSLSGEAGGSDAEK